MSAARPRVSRSGAILAAVLPWSGLAAQDRTTVDVTPIAVTTDRPTLPHVEPVVAIHPTDPDRIVVAAMAIESPHDDRFHDSWRVVVFFTTDGGRRWSRRPLPPAAAGPALGDVTLAWTADGTLYLTALVLHPDRNLHTWLWRSRDEGGSWTVDQIPAAVTGSEDHPVLDVIGLPGSTAMALFATMAQTGISASTSGANGPAFTPGTLFSPNRENNNLGAGLRLGNDRLLFTYFSMSGPMPTPLWAVSSGDAGRTWTSHRITDRHVPIGFPMLAQDRSRGPRRGRVYAVWVADEDSGQVMLAHSADGIAWSAPVVVHQDRSPVIRARPAVHVNRNGAVAVSWTDGRHDQGGRGAWCWDVYAAVSLDGGTFQPEVKLTGAVTCARTPANGAAGQRWRWGGDYAGIGSDSRSRFYVSWSDSHTGPYQPRLARLAVTTRPGSGPAPPPRVPGAPTRP